MNRSRAIRRVAVLTTGSLLLTGAVPTPGHAETEGHAEPDSRAGVDSRASPKADLCYQVATDRFADGDPGNNDPAKSPGLHDPTRQNWKLYWGGDSPASDSGWTTSPTSA